MNFDKRLAEVRAEELRVDFLEFIEKTKRFSPDMQDDRILFEAWVVQRIAAAEVLIEQLVAAQKKK